MSSENKVRIYGIDPGSIKEVEKINNLDEIDLWLTIDGLGYHIWWCNHAMSHGRIEKVDLTEEQYALEYLVYQTRKFGVELPEDMVIVLTVKDKERLKSISRELYNLCVVAF